MARRARMGLPAGVKHLQARIEEWRTTRERRTAERQLHLPNAFSRSDCYWAGILASPPMPPQGWTPCCLNLSSRKFMRVCRQATTSPHLGVGWTLLPERRLVCRALKSCRRLRGTRPIRGGIDIHLGVFHDVRTRPFPWEASGRSCTSIWDQALNLPGQPR